MGPWEIQQALSISRSRFREIVRKPDFPAPLDDTLRRGAVWYEHEIRAWIQANRPALDEDPEGA